MSRNQPPPATQSAATPPEVKAVFDPNINVQVIAGPNLRDLFAGFALASQYANSGDPRIAAARCYELADALLAVRAKSEVPAPPLPTPEATK